MRTLLGEFAGPLPRGDGRRRSLDMRHGDIALAAVTRSRRQSDQYARVFFTDTVVDYRDDNRHLWTFIEAAATRRASTSRRRRKSMVDRLPPRHYPEWDPAQLYRPDWVSGRVPCTRRPRVRGGCPAVKHAVLAKQLKRLLDLLKPPGKRRVRFQEEGAGWTWTLPCVPGSTTAAAAPDLAHQHEPRDRHGRDLAVLLLLDLSSR